MYVQVGEKIMLTLDTIPPSATDVLFVTFLILITLALASTLSAIGPSSPLPDLAKRSAGNRSSLLFYAFIANDKDWGSYIDRSPELLREQLAKDFHEEAQIIARRVRYKVARAREAASFVVTSLAALALLGIFSVDRFSVQARWWISAAFLSLLLLYPLWEVRQMSAEFFLTDRPSRLTYGLYAIAFLMAVGLMLRAEDLGVRWLSLGYSLSVILFSRFALVNRGYARAVFLLLMVAGGSAWTFALVCGT